MPLKKKEEPGELIPADTAPFWTVVTTEDGHHRLFYGTKLQEKSLTPGGLERLRRIAAWCNRRSIEPRPRIQCFADMSPPPPPRRLKKTPASSPPADVMVDVPADAS